MFIEILAKTLTIDIRHDIDSQFVTDDSKTFSHSKSITKNLYVLHYKCRTSLTNDEVIYETVPTAMMMTMSHVIGLHISSIYTFSSFYIFSLAVCAITVAIFFQHLMAAGV